MATDDIDLDQLLEGHRILLAALDERAAQVNERATRAREALAACDVEYHEIEQQRQAILTTDRLCRARFVPREEHGAPRVLPDLRVIGPTAEASAKPRARVGPQRYRMLALLRRRYRSGESLALPEIAEATSLGLRRVRDQMRSDTADGMVQEHEDRYRITPLGMDLLSRFEVYKESKGESLPPLDGPIGDDDDGEVASEPETEETEA